MTTNTYLNTTKITTNTMKLQKLSEAIVQPNVKGTAAFVKKWTTGNPLADQHLTTDVKRDLQRTVQDDTFVLYRGWKFASFEDMKEQLGTSELKAGSAFQLNTSDLRSWSKSISVAERFANPRIDTITGEHYSDHDIEKMGYNHGELLGVRN